MASVLMDIQTSEEGTECTCGQWQYQLIINSWMLGTARAIQLFCKQGRSPYQVLGVPLSASQTTIKTAFRQLAKKYHPDLNTGREEHFKDVNQAYQLLSDPIAKTHYDRIHHYEDIQGTEPHTEKREHSQKQKFEESSDPRDRILFEELRRQQEQHLKEYVKFKRERYERHERGRDDRHERGRDRHERQRRSNYQNSENEPQGQTTHSRKETESRRASESKLDQDDYNEQFDRSKDSLLGFLGEAAKGAWEMWINIKNRK